MLWAITLNKVQLLLPIAFLLLIIWLLILIRFSVGLIEVLILAIVIFGFILAPLLFRSYREARKH
jgi:positive regulator of sigma E activity